MPRCWQSYVTDKYVEETGGKPRIIILEVPFQISFVVIQRYFSWCIWRCCMFFSKWSRWRVQRMCWRSSVSREIFWNCKMGQRMTHQQQGMLSRDCWQKIDVRMRHHFLFEVLKCCSELQILPSNYLVNGHTCQQYTQKWQNNNANVCNNRNICCGVSKYKVWTSVLKW